MRMGGIMFKVFTTDDSQWDECVKNFKNLDIYQDRDYYLALERYLNVKIVLLYYHKGNSYVCEILQINDISKFEPFKKFIKPNTLFDAETPYGYGGPLLENASDEILKEYYDLKNEWATENKIVSEFTRFNPLEQNYKYTNTNQTLLNIKSTIYMDLQSEEQIIKDMDSKNRNMIRKAIKNNVLIKIADDSNLEYVIDKFKHLYKETMDRNKATEFYYFDDQYFDKFFKDMKGKYKLFYAEYNNDIIATSIFIFNNKNIHYYLSGANKKFLNLAPNNLLLFEVAKWGVQNGFERFHLGGGVSNNDALFGFKKQFNKNGVLPFYIARQIYNQKEFDKLIDIRVSHEKDFDIEKKFLIKYRQEKEHEK